MKYNMYEAQIYHFSICIYVPCQWSWAVGTPVTYRGDKQQGDIVFPILQNGPGQRQAIIWTSAGILLIGPLRGNFSKILIKIETFSLKKMHLKMSSKNGDHLVPASIC